MERSHPKSIKLPETLEVFRNIKNAKGFAIDIGISLTKIAYWSTISHRRALYDEGFINSKDDSKMVYEVSEGARLHFIKFETKYIENCLDFINQNLVGAPSTMMGKSIKGTGGGTYKYSELILSKLGLTVEKENEISCLIKGCNFLLKNMADESFVFQRHGNPEYKFQSVDPDIFPYLLVNIGSGVSIMKVESEDSYERIGGTATGGATFWGLGSLLTKAKGFDELLELAEKGDHRKVDVLIKDLTGRDYLELPGDLIAASFGKAALMKEGKDSEPGNQFSECDVARSLLFTISNDIGQIACLYAMMHGLKKVYFGGYFLSGHPLSMHTVSFAINFWSRGAVQPLFLRHEGYLGAIGAFLKGAEECDAEKYSWLENYAGSSGLGNPMPTHIASDSLGSLQCSQPENLSSTASMNCPLGVASPVGLVVDQLEMDRWEPQAVYCPLLARPAKYVPDTEDLTQDAEAREYWLSCFEESVEKFALRAMESQPGSSTAKDRAHKFKQKYVCRLHYLREHPFAYGCLTVRSLLDTIEHCLKEFDFPDPYLKQKQEENERAFAALPSCLQKVDNLEWRERQELLITMVLAGNVFDWGAREVAELMESSDFGLEEASHHLEKRPWMVDNLDAWIERIKGPPHNCAAIFVDNSGVDIVLGVLPLARELLKRKTKVILCANSAPALNDVTFTELLMILKQAGSICNIIKTALAEGRLIGMETGQAGPCLDLSRISRKLADAMVSHKVDLVIIEGMGRSIHTNLDAVFVCESLKVAVVKNRWLAKRLGGDMFSVMCKYEQAPKERRGQVC
ncbi:4'-phosphopantetheine phosphatase [Hetaerina americana]|uniref:4'-phosphopantetheine phosphatase n=1 Tax=Hetaerina americana TaxID=62018 RepID=UPI003A7F1F6D